MNNTPRTTSHPRTGTYPGSDDHERAGERVVLGFELRDTLADTKVREVSFTEFLAALKQNRQQAA